MSTFAIFTMLLMSLPTLAAKTPSFCESLLGPSLKDLHALQTKLGPAGDSVGTPGAQLNRPVLAADDTVTLDSDLGPSRWERVEYMHWMDLAAYLATPQDAHTELLRIANSQTYCTPGLLPALCRALRLSRKIRQDASNRAKDGIKDHGLDAVMNYARKMMWITHAEHIKQSALKFAWGTQMTVGYDDLDLWQAKVIMRVLVRETLIRHLEISHDEKIYAGRDLPLDSRLMIASYPGLAGLMPIFLRHPLDIDKEFAFGGSMSDEIAIVNYVNIENPYGFTTWINATIPIRDSYNSELEVRIDVSLDDDDDTEVKKFEANYEAMETYYQEKIERIAAEFSHELGLKKSLNAEVTWRDGDPTINVQIYGVGFATKLLFIYRMQERLSSELTSK